MMFDDTCYKMLQYVTIDVHDKYDITYITGLLIYDTILYCI